MTDSRVDRVGSRDRLDCSPPDGERKGRSRGTKWRPTARISWNREFLTIFVDTKRIIRHVTMTSTDLVLQDGSVQTTPPYDVVCRPKGRLNFGELFSLFFFQNYYYNRIIWLWYHWHNTYQQFCSRLHICSVVQVLALAVSSDGATVVMCSAMFANLSDLVEARLFLIMETEMRK